MVRELDKLFLLQTDRYHEKKQQLKQAFLELNDRPPSHVGAYPENELELKRMLDNILTSGADDLPAIAGRVRALVAPHIDLNVGHNTYGKAYSALKTLKPKRLIILGTGHAIDEGLFSLTTKDYQTPLGSLPTDKDAVMMLKCTGNGVVADDDFAHRNEHAIEFQMLFLRQLFPADVAVVPVLCGSFNSHLAKVGRPADIPEVARFLNCLAELIDEETLLIAGVDLSHVGPKFGHLHPAAYYEQEFSGHDHALLAALCSGSAQAFWSEGKRVEDRYHVCGFSALSCLLELLPGITGQVLDYQIWHETQTSSAVSYAAAILNS
jgi:AmmeMemoRadiSam system protein B